MQSTSAAYTESATIAFGIWHGIFDGFLIIMDGIALNLLLLKPDGRAACASFED
jgi:hypothetical protein